MILADTSVWIEHLRSGNAMLAKRLDRGAIWIHPFIAGEIALGNLRDRATVLEALDSLPAVTVATDREVRHFIETEFLAGRGIGYVDAHLLAAVRLTPGCRLWTRDRRLGTLGKMLGFAANPD
ncbi:MAG: type II toxin-antitoxin system VapC family toxin [Parvibaculaceae bacterium]